MKVQIAKDVELLNKIEDLKEKTSKEDLNEIVAIQTQKISDEIFINFGFTLETLQKSAAVKDITCKNCDELIVFVVE